MSEPLVPAITEPVPDSSSGPTPPAAEDFDESDMDTIDDADWGTAVTDPTL